MANLEEHFYEIAAREVAAGRCVTGVMAKAFSDADGDEKKAIARYLKLRVSQLALEHQESTDRMAADEKLRRAQESATSAKEQATTRACCWNCTHFMSTPAWLDNTKGKCARHERKTFAYDRCDDHEPDTSR